jgi:hypothetical protein
MRKIQLMNEEKRDATLALESVKERPGPVTGVPGKKLAFRRYLATTEAGTYAKLCEQYADVAQALIDGDPEIDLEQVGKLLSDTQTVFLSSKGEVLHASPKLVDVVFGPDGAERERKPAVDIPGNTTEKEAPVRFAGRRMSRSEVVTKFAFRRTVQIKHVDGLSFDFLYKMAKELHDKNEVALLGAGPKGRDPLIFQENGTPYRGFLEGRVDGQRYKLLLHLSNLELRAPGASAST